MRDANKETFGKDRPTDIISHAGNSKYIRREYHLNRSPMQAPEFRHLGEIMLCPGIHTICRIDPRYYADYIHKQMIADIQIQEDPPDGGTEQNISG